MFVRGALRVDEAGPASRVFGAHAGQMWCPPDVVPADIQETPSSPCAPAGGSQLQGESFLGWPGAFSKAYFLRIVPAEDSAASLLKKYVFAGQLELDS